MEGGGWRTPNPPQPPTAQEFHRHVDLAQLRGRPGDCMACKLPVWGRWGPGGYFLYVSCLFYNCQPLKAARMGQVGPG